MKIILAISFIIIFNSILVMAMQKPAEGLEQQKARKIAELKVLQEQLRNTAQPTPIRHAQASIYGFSGARRMTEQQYYQRNNSIMHQQSIANLIEQKKKELADLDSQ